MTASAYLRMVLLLLPLAHGHVLGQCLCAALSFLSLLPLTKLVATTGFCLELNLICQS